jgi:hypothetical protein
MTAALSHPRPASADAAPDDTPTAAPAAGRTRAPGARQRLAARRGFRIGAAGHAAGQQRCINRARHNRIHPNAIGDKVKRHDARQAKYGTFRGDIGAIARPAGDGEL